MDRRELSDALQEGAVGTSYLRLNIGMLTTSRAVDNPHGGEDGDGRENGVNHENDLNNIAVFIIRGNMNSDATTPFLYKDYIVRGNPNWIDRTLGVDITFQVIGYTPQNNDLVIVVANAGNITSSISTLGELRDYTTYSAWYNSTSLTANNMFVMSSAYNNGTEGIIKVTGHTGEKSDPYLASDINIQRAAARIDFMYKEGDNYSSSTPDELFYVVKNSTGTDRVATVHLDHIIPVNLMQESSYLIKRVTTAANVTSSVQHGALETGSASVAPSTYVIEPHTILKQSTVEDATLNTWYGTSTRAKTVFGSPNTYATTATSISHYMSDMTASVSELTYFDKAMTLAYTNENTQSKEQQKPDFMTGLLLKTIYEPNTVYNAYDAGTKTLTKETGYTKGTTFWRYTPTKTSMAEENSKYFTTSSAATDYKTAHPEDLAEIVEYPGGVCYYNIWLRHANVDRNPHETFPMEYGIVRNNIYRIGVEKFTGPGTPTPSYEAPDHLYLRIFVRPWNLRKQPEIRL